MKTYESTAKTVEEAITAGLAVLGASISDVDIVVLEEGSKGLFGLFGSRQARVKLTMKEEENFFDQLTEKKPAKPEKPATPKTEKPVKAEKPAAPKAERAEKAEKPAAPKSEKSAAPKAEKTEKAEKPAAPKAEKKSAPRSERKPAPKAEKPEVKEEKKPLPPKAPAKPLEKPVVTMIPNEEVVADSAAGKAQTFLKELTHLMGVEVEVAVGNDAEGNVFVSMTGDTLGILIGRRGETLDALQYLTSLKVNRGQEGYTRVTLDTENYRAKREDTLIRLANRMANRAVKTGRKVSLEPMNPYERRIIHSALQANEAVDTHSEGDEPNRHVVITLRK